MKLHLPKALLLSVVTVVATGAAQAASTTVTPQIIVGTEDALKNALTTSSPENVSDKYTKPVVWASEEATTVSGFNASITAPLYVREGDLTIENSELKSAVALEQSQAQIVVSGKDASLTFSGTNFKDSSNYAFIQVGGPDGRGTLNISDNSNVQIAYSLCAGHHKNANWSDDFYIINSTTETAQGGDRYNAGDEAYIKVTIPNEVRYYGQGTINVNSGSTLTVGSDIFLAEANLNIDDATINHTNAGGDFSDDDNWNRLGRQTGSTTKVSITNGGVWNTNGRSITSGVQDLDGTEVTIEVSGTKDGKASTLNVRGAQHGTIALGIGTQDAGAANNKNTTTLMVSGGGKVLAKDIMLGVQEAKGYYGNDTVTVEVGAESSMEADLITIAKGATVTNCGTIEGEITLQASGSLICASGVIDGLVAEGGSFSVYGAMGTTGNITLAGTSFIFTDGAVIDLGGKNFTYGEGNNIVIYMSDVMLADADGEYVLQGLTFNNAGTVTGLSEDVEVTLVSGADDTEGTKVTLKASDIKVNAVPEPTTATLSLLALAALAGRRRRK